METKVRERRPNTHPLFVSFQFRGFLWTVLICLFNNMPQTFLPATWILIIFFYPQCFCTFCWVHIHIHWPIYNRGMAQDFFSVRILSFLLCKIYWQHSSALCLNRVFTLDKKYPTILDCIWNNLRWFSVLWKIAVYVSATKQGFEIWY